MPSFSPVIGLFICVVIIAVGLVLIFAQIKLFAIAKDLRRVLEILERSPQRRDG
jgi:hypothetical protein